MTPFETFYREHYRPMLGIALALARDTGTAEDLVQEAFISAHRRWDRISQYDNPQAWVRRVLINRATSLRRRLGAEKRAVIPGRPSPATATRTAMLFGRRPHSGRDRGLPPAVAETRNALIAAAFACDLPMLRELAGSGFTTSFGGGDGDDLSLWEEEGRGQLGTLLKLFDMSHAETSHEGRIIYVWPVAHAYESWEAIPTEAIEELATVHGEDDLDRFATFGSYTGWRTAIDEDGEWLFLVAGD